MKKGLLISFLLSLALQGCGGRQAANYMLESQEMISVKPAKGMADLVLIDRKILGASLNLKGDPIILVIRLRDRFQLRDKTFEVEWAINIPIYEQAFFRIER